MSAHPEDRPVFLIAACVATVLLIAGVKWIIQHRAQQAAVPLWVSVRIAYRYPGWYFSSERLHRAYSTQRACQHALPPSGMQTLGNTTERVEWYCERVLR
ncbi:MAG: hypothetical protein ACP5P4_15130 [Steroidobacteraceae bacterium]